MGHALRADCAPCRVRMVTPCVGDELKAARKRLKLSQAELAILLKTPARTLQDWEAGRRRVPGIALVAVVLLQERDERVMASIKAQIEERLDREFPHGIPSAPIQEDEEL